ncbi:N [Niakha virus]|uniref:Nucleoprotein n=1 Tax=Niakha virus TaxID=1348439 RepID=R9ZTJ8_9RHAB|nr:N [Niakha virus] [Niakha virus]AGO44080.1 N [Niakha virus] [Niakha virus]
MASKSMYLIGSNESIVTQENRFGKNPIYPSEFFKKKEKPTVTIKTSVLSTEGLKAVVIEGLRNATLHSDVFLTWLYRSNFGAKLKLEEKWTSFGIKIGDEGEEISFRDLVTVKEEGVLDTSSLVGDADAAKACSDLGVAIVGLSTFRLSGKQENQANHRKKLAERIEALSENELKGKLSVIPNRGLSTLWMMDKNFLKTCAAVDMFFYRFPLSEDAKCRVSLMGCRYKDCSAFVAMGYMCRITGLSEADLLSWVWLERVGKQIVAILKSGEECEAEYSYFPYQSSFCLTPCSAYSVTQNPDLYLWIQLTGCLLLNKRSLNAIKSGDVNTYDVGKMATMLGFACSRSFSFKKIFSEKAGDTSKVSGDTEKSIGGSPTGKNGETWLRFFVNGGKVMPDEVKDWFKECQDKMPATRPDTVGDLLRSLVL